MRIASINLGNFGSTGFIMKNIGVLAQEAGHEVMIAYPGNPINLPKDRVDTIICTDFERRFNERIAYETGYRGIHGWISTRRFLSKLKRFSPDIIHLHNLHNNYINVDWLFRDIKKNNIRVIWTLLECWAFTGQCPHFTITKCEKWKNGCNQCPSFREYPRSKVDRTEKMWKLKKQWFTGVSDLTIVTPSQWLADLVKQSFLKDYSVKVINNGIDLSIFKPIQSDFRKRYNISLDKKILLGVAFGWGRRKGLDVFVELSKRLDPEKYQIVLVGTDDKVDSQLPQNIISIQRTSTQRELAEIYTAADLFVNPTREENYPTVNMEALACGTPVITFKTGGSPEIVNESCGRVVECDDVDDLVCVIKQLLKNYVDMSSACLDRAKNFAMHSCFDKYIQLYNETEMTEYGNAVN